MTTHRRQMGFSLLELLVAMMIIAVLGTLGMRQYTKHTATARYLKASDTLKSVGEGLDLYYLKHGKYPDFGSYEAMIEGNSPLVKENLIAPNLPQKDPWDQPYQGKSNKSNYELKCEGDPSNQEERGPIIRAPGRVSESK